MLIPVFLVILSCFHKIATAYIIKHEIKSAARYGAWLSDQGMDSSSVERAITGRLLQNCGMVKSGDIKVSVTQASDVLYYVSKYKTIEVECRAGRGSVFLNVLPDFYVKYHFRTTGGDTWLYGKPR